nr:MAG TPA: Eco29kI restriction endonuclease [Caudoviricetes sp.]
MPMWDCLHPGRAWTERLQPCALTAKELDRRVRDYLNNALLN